MSFVNKAKQQANDYIQGKGSNAMNSAMSAVATGVSSALNSGISGGLSSGAGNVIGGLGKLAGNIPGPYGAAASVALQAVGGLVNRTFGSSLNQDNINAVNNNITALTGFQSNVNSFDELNQNIASSPLEMDFNESFIGKDGWASNTAKNTYNRLKAKQGLANAFKENSITNNLGNISTEQSQDLLAQSFGFGGSLTTHGAEFPTGLISINNGGSHEENPYDGVQMGVDPQGIPNLVEEGETIYNDYVFSKRLKVPEKLRNKYKLGGEISFADASKKLAKEHEERPNDSISTNGFKYFMDELSSAQEEIRQNKEMAKQKRQAKRLMSQLTPEELAIMQQQAIPQEQIPQESYPQEEMMPTNYAACGGKLANKYDGLTELTQKLKFTENPDALDFSDKGSPLFKNTTTAYRPKTIEDLGIILSDLQGSNTTIDNEGLGRAIRGMQAIEQGNNPKYAWKGYKPSKDKTKGFDETDLRFTQPLTKLAGIVQNLSSNADYKRADAIANKATLASQYDTLSPKKLSEYLRYKPFDRLTAINQLNAKSASTIRNIKNAGLGASTGASILAADYNAGNLLGNLFRQAEESNQAQEERITNFNRATNQYNSQAGLEAARANQAMRHQAQTLDYQGFLQSMQIKEAIDAQRNAALNDNITGFANSLYGIGQEAYNRNVLKSVLGYAPDRTGRYLYTGFSKGGKLKKK